MDAPTHSEALRQVRAAGFTIDESDYPAKSFGSWYITVLTTPRRRLIWDGKERWYTVEEETSELWNGSRKWKAIWTQREPNAGDYLTGIEVLKS